MSDTSACVGFCPRARSRSPIVSLGTAPVPFLSKSANASLYSKGKLEVSQKDVWRHRGTLARVVTLQQGESAVFWHRCEWSELTMRTC